MVWERGFKDLWPQTERAAAPKGRRRRGSKDCRNGPWSLHWTLFAEGEIEINPQQLLFQPEASRPGGMLSFPASTSELPKHSPRLSPDPFIPSQSLHTPWGTAAAAKETRGAAASPKGEGKGQSWQQEVPAGAAHGAGAAAAPEGTEHPGEGSRAKTAKWVFPTGAPTKPPEVKSIRAACAPSQCCTLGCHLYCPHQGGMATAWARTRLCPELGILRALLLPELSGQHQPRQERLQTNAGSRERLGEVALTASYLRAARQHRRTPPEFHPLDA